ncbi:MAG: hypothetical protein M3O30_02575 [Planctomycetota bacterium]|nr:hypothetical protein [Planctomycetota bacterium]
MVDEGQVIRGINWRSTFPFINIFRSFRVAIHMSKLALGLALLLAIYFGGLILDSAWPVRARAIPGEVELYEGISTGTAEGTLASWRADRQNEIDSRYATLLQQHQIINPESDAEAPSTTRDRAMAAAYRRHYVGEVQSKILHDRDDAVADLDKTYQKAVATADDAFNANSSAPDAARNRDDAKAAALAARNTSIGAAYDDASQQYYQVEQARGMGLFHVFFDYEVRQITMVVEAAVRNDWIGPSGVGAHVANFFTIAPIWLIWHHTVFFIVFAIYFLLAWALFGGAISRIAAVHIARDEKISVRQAMNFAVGKLLSFASAPVIPILIVVVIGLVVAAASLLGNIPFLGPIAIGAFFILPLLAGAVMTLVLLGTAGGFNLMYPTIAVEGSDSFDAISRSFSYVYARPWRMLFYTAVAVAYGAATYMFVHLFLMMLLVLTHHFVGIGMWTAANNTRDLFTTMWPSPSVTGRLSYHVDYTMLSPAQKLGAFLLHGWVMLLVFFLGAFAISLYFSANTIIYYLMRSEVDATEMDDVYLEQSEDDLEPSPPASGPTPVVATTTTVIVAETVAPEAPPIVDAPPADIPPATDAPPTV